MKYLPVAIFFIVVLVAAIWFKDSEILWAWIFGLWIKPDEK